MTTDPAPLTNAAFLARQRRSAVRLGIALVALAGLFACARMEYIEGTTVLKTQQNQDLIDVIETYRQRLLTRNVDGLLVLASDKYFEDSGTPRSDDDYGYQGLREVLNKKLQRVKSLRYDLEYRSINVKENRAEIEVFIDGSFELAAESGDRYRRVNDYHRFVLEKDKKTEKWKFLSGM
ncbi:MAG TPA: hypothetical protein VH374_06460 [Polyangia bacterium]|nr:hypothetical protein [Polyangia bacterium]